MRQSQAKQDPKARALDWEQLDAQHRVTFQREYVACHEPHERGWLVENVMLAFPQYRKSVVERAIQEVCTAMTVTPRRRKEFLERLHQQLESHRPQKTVLVKKDKS
jgi:acyl-CoA reductase-like NAD-dependent aldehyde dehydrogenase